VTRRWGPRPGAGQTVTGSVVFGDVIQISGVGGNLVISRDRPPYRVTATDDRPRPLNAAQARAQPSRLLLAQYQIVPFTGRDRTLDRLAGWVGGEEPVAALLLHAAGGQGKTRLAAQVSAQCTATGWATWQVTHTPTPVNGTNSGVSQAELPGGAMLAVVDYADRWPASALLALLTQLRDLHAQAGTRVRVLMLARSDGYWWPALAHRADSDLGVDTDQIPLPTLAADSTGDRAALFTTAAAHFAAALQFEQPTGGWPAPDLTGGGFGQVLAVHMAALATIDAAQRGHTPPVRPEAVSEYLLLREQSYWQQLHTRGEDPLSTPPEMMHRAVVTATLTGGQPRTVARDALQQAGFADTGPAADQIIDDHTACYPPADTRTVLEPLHPDRLGEDLIALSFSDDHGTGARLARDWAPETVTRLLTTEVPQSPAWIPTAVTVLVEAAHRWSHLAEQVLYPLIRTHPQTVIAAGGAALTRLTDIPGLDPTVLIALEPLLPVYRHLDLDVAAAAITTRLAAHHRDHTTNPAELALLYAAEAFRLANAGRRQEALAPAGKAVTIRRQLAEANPDAYLPDLAKSLSNLGEILAGLGHRQQALAPVEEAIHIYRRLAEDDLGAHLPSLASSLNNLAENLSGLGRHQQALTATKRALVIRQRLAKDDPGAHLADFALSWNNLGEILSRLGRHEQALTATETAVVIRKQLAEANPDAYLADLAMSLLNLGLRLSTLGRREQALAPAEESVRLYRRLAETNPDAYLPGLGTSLNNLGGIQSALGRREEAQALAEEAVTISRRLAEANPDAHLVDLAMSLNNLGAALSDLGFRGQALSPVEEGADLYRRLAAANPDAYLPALATSLTELDILLFELGRRDEALAPAEEAIGVYRRLVEANPAAYLAGLAASLTHVAALQWELRRGEPALTAAEEAIGLYRRLVEVNPVAYLPELAKWLTKVAAVLSELRRGEQALTAAEEAADLYRPLAEANPGAYLPELGMSLWVYGLVCVNVQANLPQALESVTEAIGLYKALREYLPNAFDRELFAAYETLADVFDGLGRTAEAADLRRQLAEVAGGLGAMIRYREGPFCEGNR
jgi:hypothetical protein